MKRMLRRPLVTEDFKDLSGDPVYDYVKSEMLEGGELLGGRIEEPTIHLAGSPRKFLHIAIQDHFETKIIKYSLNYNKLLKELSNDTGSTITS